MLEIDRSWDKHHSTTLGTGNLSRDIVNINSLYNSHIKDTRTNMLVLVSLATCAVSSVVSIL